MAALVLYLGLAVAVTFQEEAAPIAGALAAHHGHGDLSLVILSCGVGTYLGDLLLFAIGRRARRRTARAPFQRALSFIRRHPNAAPLAVRFAYGMRFALPIGCGASGLPFASFALWVGVSAAVWATTFGLVGWGAGELAMRLFHGATHHELPLIGLVLLVWLMLFLVFHLRGGRHHVEPTDPASA